jgi:opacity protein-like surface antigen
MKRSLGLLTGCLFIFGMLQAQKKPSKLFAELSLGPSIPLGQFAEKTYNGPAEEDQPGMASTGLSANVTAGYYLKENFGILLTAGYTSNKQKEEGYRENIEKAQTAPSTVDVNTGNWKMYKVMAGGFFVTPLVEDKLNLVTKLSAGICKTAIPSHEWAIAGTGTVLGGAAFSMGRVGKEKLPTAFCYQVGLGLQYKLNQHIHVLFDVNSFNATAKHEFSTYYGSASVFGPGLTELTTVNRKFKFGSVNALLGIGVRF